MASVFIVNKDFTVIVNPDAAKLVPELLSLSEDQLKYVILVIDYVDGPFRRLPLSERKIMAARKVFNKDSVKESEKVLNAMEGYKGLVFDIRRETVDALKEKVLRLHQELMKDSTTPTQLQNIDKSITFLEKRIDAMEMDLDIEEKEKIELKAGRQLSYLEMWQRNQMKHQEYKTTI